MWIGVTPRFEQFLNNITLTNDQLADGQGKADGITSCLNRAYWGTNSETEHRLMVGSWGKYTRTRPPRDIDLLFELPWAVYTRFEERVGNKQSQLLQEVRSHLLATYSTTRMRGDNQVVVVPFNTFEVEVLPAFKFDDGRYLICNTKDDGRYKIIHPTTEIATFNVAASATNYNLRSLVRLMKTWQRECNVPLPSFQIELVAADFLSNLWYGTYSLFWFDWMCRDFFAYLISRANTSVYIAGTNEAVPLGDAWLSRAETAHDRAVQACEYERADLVVHAGDEWQNIFGIYVPRVV